MLRLGLPVGLMPPALKHEAHAFQELRLRPVRVVDVEGRSVVVLEVPVSYTHLRAHETSAHL
eukprot:12111750-Alexandrium_andersonii.AAC.1